MGFPTLTHFNEYRVPVVRQYFSSLLFTSMAQLDFHARPFLVAGQSKYIACIWLAIFFLKKWWNIYNTLCVFLNFWQVFEFFQISEKYLCAQDNLIVYDGGSENAKKLGHLCGADIPKRIVSSTNELYLILDANPKYDFRGFSAHYTTGLLLLLTL